MFDCGRRLGHWLCPSSGRHVSLPMNAAVSLRRGLRPIAEMETKMPKTILSILGVLVIAALTVQVATAAPRKARRATRTHAVVNHQPPRNAFGSVPKAGGSKSC